MALKSIINRKLIMFIVMSFCVFNLQAQEREDNLIDAIQNKTSEEPAEVDSQPTSSTNSGSFRTPKRHGFGLGIGQTVLGGDFADYGDDKITIDFFYTYLASYSFDLLVNLHFNSLEKDDSTTYLRAGTVGVKGRLYDFDQFSPYLVGGVGFYRPGRDTPQYGKSTSKTVFGLNAGAGFDLQLNEEFSIGLLSMLHLPFKVAQDDGPDVEGRYLKVLLTGFYFF